MRYLDELAPDAGLIGAVNTVRWAGDRLVGESTDGKGFLRSLRDASIDPRGRNVVILGAGGAARAIAVELALAGASRITVVNRSIERGEQLAAALDRNTSVAVDFVPWTSTYDVPDRVSILVNATSIGLFPCVGGAARRRSRHAATRPRRVRRDPEPATDPLPDPGSGAWRDDAGPAGDARLPGHNRIHDVDRA